MEIKFREPKFSVGDKIHAVAGEGVVTRVRASLKLTSAHDALEFIYESEYEYAIKYTNEEMYDLPIFPVGEWKIEPLDQYLKYMAQFTSKEIIE